LAKQGWRLISTVTRGGTYKFVLEKEEQYYNPPSYVGGFLFEMFFVYFYYDTGK
jgi:hypothetical protein